ncbi:MAG: preprotein translocase subunit SecG [Candidatus Omnitrophota bacterium]|nr:MAG: preprotein translocase subunit SecG [Candidatus Omnitrophota bacterium]
MYIFLLIIHIIVALFLVFIILIQSGKGEGLSDVFGGGSSQTTIFGTRTGNFLTKATTASAIIFMVTSLSLAFVARNQGTSVVQKELFKEQIEQKMQKILQNKEPVEKGTLEENQELKPLGDEIANEDSAALNVEKKVNIEKKIEEANQDTDVNTEQK